MNINGQEVNINDLYDKNILNDKELESIKGKDDYDL